MSVSIGIIAPWDGKVDGDDAQFEVRAFFGARHTRIPSAAASMADRCWSRARRLRRQPGTTLGRAAASTVARIGNDPGSAARRRSASTDASASEASAMGVGFTERDAGQAAPAA
jgi:hypothetical protein